MRAVVARALRDERRLLPGWLVGLALVCLVTLGSWPAVRGSAADLDRVLADLPPALTAFAGQGIASFSAAGLIGSRLFGTVGLALVVGFAVSRGARALAGEAQQGTLELLAAQPVSRTTLAIGKVVAAALALAVLVGAELLVLVVTGPLMSLGFATSDILAAGAGLYVLAALFGAVAFFCSACTLRRPSSVACGAGLAAGLFLLTGLGALVDPLEPLARLSPFTHYDGSSVLANGVPLLPLLVEAVAAIALVAAGVLVFDRSDLG